MGGESGENKVTYFCLLGDISQMIVEIKEVYSLKTLPFTPLTFTLGWLNIDMMMVIGKGFSFPPMTYSPYLISLNKVHMGWLTSCPFLFSSPLILFLNKFTGPSWKFSQQTVKGRDSFPIVRGFISVLNDHNFFLMQTTNDCRRVSSLRKVDCTDFTLGTAIYTS